MDDAAPTTPPGPRLLAGVASARLTRLVTTTWWVVVGSVAVLSYLATITSEGLAAPVGGAIFMAGLTVVAAVARNASAEAAKPGSVRRGSLLRAAAFGAVVHGGLLAAVAFGEVSLVTGLLIVAGAALVALTRPTTLVALGVDPDAPAPASPAPEAAAGPGRLSTPAIIAELRATAAEVRSAPDPQRLTALVERRGELISILADRDPEALDMLLDDSPAGRPSGDAPDGPQPA